ncbi:hypothetical protein F2Q69_00050407 [Brassica cretica]|uniref:Strictosidine synthase conserved region domain-containing protein n=1 Tax=Brassica cretica TaxID=69181 RepID=A0A8S9PSB9_BRACR|nr:hypothetical protein F2Q69_00050407 [Brassica cretica]
MISSLSTISLLLSLCSAVISVDAFFQKLLLPGDVSGPRSIAFDSTGKGFYTGVYGGKILKYTPETGFVDFVYMTTLSKSSLCHGIVGPLLLGFCGRPAGIALNEKTGDLYVADAALGLHVVSPAGGLAVKIADSVDGKPIKNLDGLDVDPTTGVVYFTSLTSNSYPVNRDWPLEDVTGTLYKYDPSTKVVTIVMEGLFRSTGCAVNSNGSFVLVSQLAGHDIKRYWIKGPKAGSSEDFNILINSPESIRRIGSTENFWVVSAMSYSYGVNQSAVVLDSNGRESRDLQGVSIWEENGDNLVSEVNESNGSLYIGTFTGNYVGIYKLWKP